MSPYRDTDSESHPIMLSAIWYWEQVPTFNVELGFTQLSTIVQSYRGDQLLVQEGGDVMQRKL